MQSYLPIYKQALQEIFCSSGEGHGELLHEENYVQASPGKKKCVLCARSVQTRTEFLQHEERLHVK